VQYPAMCHCIEENRDALSDTTSADAGSSAFRMPPQKPR
jgi:hypothetical protein